MKNIYFLDFDGVICDSAKECAYTSWLTGSHFWQNWKQQSLPEDFKSIFKKLRPVIETGFECVLLMRLIADSVPPEKILANFHELCQAELQKYKIAPAELNHVWGITRDAWIARDLNGWLELHDFYQGVLDKISFAMKEKIPVFILTTKQERFVLQLLEKQNISFPKSYLFGLDKGRKKEQIMLELLNYKEYKGGIFHFIEDRLPTLERVFEYKELNEVRLYLALWGYCTEAEKKRATELPRIHPLQLRDFSI